MLKWQWYLYMYGDINCVHVISTIDHTCSNCEARPSFPAHSPKKPWIMWIKKNVWMSSFTLISISSPRIQFQCLCLHALMCLECDTRARVGIEALDCHRMRNCANRMGSTSEIQRAKHSESMTSFKPSEPF